MRTGPRASEALQDMFFLYAPGDAPPVPRMRASITPGHLGDAIIRVCFLAAAMRYFETPGRAEPVRTRRFSPDMSAESSTINGVGPVTGIRCMGS